MSASRKYELVYIVAPETGDEDLAGIHEQIESVVTRFGGTIESTENWGRRKMAYEIGRQKEGLYILEVLTGAGELLKELDRRLRVSDQVMRHLIIRIDEEAKVAERTRTRRKTKVARRRAARGLPAETETTGVPAEGQERQAVGESSGSEQ